MRLKTFGGLTIEAAGAVLGGAAARRRPLAVLAVVTAAGARGITRDKLASIFWPESDPDRARNALNQTLFSLRRELREPQILLGNADLRLNPAVITSDAGDFDLALAAGDLETAAALHTGPFLDGVYLKDAPEFERWLDGERARYTHAATSALRTLAAQSAAGGDHERAADWLRRLVAMNPADARATVGLMTALAAVGDRAGALDLARRHEGYMRDELHAGADPAVLALATRLRTPAEPLPAVEPNTRPAPSAPAVTAPSAAPAPPAPATSTVPAAAERAAPGGAPPDAPLVPLVPATPAAAVADEPPAAEPREEASDPPSLAPLPFAAVPPEPRRRRRVARAWRLALPIAAVVSLVVAGRALLFEHQPARPAAAAQPARVAPRAAEVVAVAPFRVRGATPQYDYLREGMVDLLSAALADGTHTRYAADPGALLNAWHAAAPGGEANWTPETALRVARQVGATKVVLGAVVGSAERVVLRAQLIDLAGAPTLAAEVDGPPDSLPTLVERLAIRLLARETGERAASVAVLAGTPLAAVHAYLDGRAAYRRGDYDRALDDQQRALEGDSTFALAAIELCRVAGWVGNTPLRHLGYAVAWRERARLSAPDRLYLRAVTGPRYPAPSSRTESRRAWEQVAETEPEHPEGWFEVGDLLFHSPWLAGPDDSPARAYFLRAIAEAPGFIPALQHLAQLAARNGDTALVREIGARAVSADPNGDVAAFIRWRMAASLGDTAALARARSTFPTIGLSPLMWVAMAALGDAPAPEDAALALATRLRRGTTVNERIETLLGLHALAVASGRRRDAERVTATLDSLGAEDLKPLQFRVYDALYAQGDTAAADSAVRAFLAGAAREDTLDRTAFWRRRVRGYCAAGQWQAFRGDLAGAERVGHALRTAGRGDVVAGPADAGDQAWSSEARMCALLIDAAVGAGGGRPDAAARLERLDRYLSAGPATSSLTWDTITLATARLFERSGDIDRALRAIRRRDHYYRWPQYLAVQLYEEGRLARLNGEQGRADAAYRHYLKLRAAPDGPAVVEVAAVRALLRGYASAR